MAPAVGRPSACGPALGADHQPAAVAHLRGARPPAGRTLAAGLLLLGALVGGAEETGAAEAPTSEDCLACHADKGLTRSAPGRGRSAGVFVDAAVLGASTHAGLDCVACHVAATVPHEERLPPVRCAGCHADPAAALSSGAHASRAGPGAPPSPTCAACHGTHGVRPAAGLGLDACAGCHADQVRLYRDSVHGRSRQRAGSEAATCQSCHGPAHTPLAKSDPQAPTYHLNLPRTCARCHADPALARRYNIPAGNVYQLYMDSIHGRAVSRSGLLVAANCSDCHGSHDIRPPGERASRVHRDNVPATCGRCHAGILREYQGSTHGQQAAAGNPVAPVCIDCHSAHEIRRVEAEAWKLDIVRECGTCHAESLRTYRDTFHGKVTALGFTRVARCSDCHSAHTVRPARDPASAVHPANRVQTCRKCHPAANENFARYDPHADPESRARNAWLYYTARFMRWLLVGTFSFFGLHTAVWGVRSLTARPGAGEPPDGEHPGDDRAGN